MGESTAFCAFILMFQIDSILMGLLIVFYFFLFFFLPFLSVNAETSKDILNLNFETKLLKLIPLKHISEMKLNS